MKYKKNYLSENMNKIALVIIALLISLIFFSIIISSRDDTILVTPAKQNSDKFIEIEYVVLTGTEQTVRGYDTYTGYSDTLVPEYVPAEAQYGRILISVPNKPIELTKAVGELSLYQGLNAITKYLNIRAFEIADKYMQSTSNIPEEYRDALLLMAMSRVETGIYTNFNSLYSSAVPSIGEIFTVDIIDNYSAQKAIRNKKLWSTHLPPSIKHQGPLQMGIDYGVSTAVIPNDLDHMENNTGLSDYYVSSNTSTYTPTLVGGDRFNWADACNRTAGVIDTWYIDYSNFNNVYEFVALVGMAHNVGGAIFTSPPNYTVQATYFPWKNIGAAREYAKAICSSDMLYYLQNKAIENIRLWREGQISTPDYGIDNNWCYNLLENSSVDKSLYYLKGDYKNRLSYPIKMLYYYFTLHELYYNAM